MIDTVIIYINNLDKYPTINEKFHNPQKKKGAITQAYVDESTGEVTERVKVPVTVYHDYNSIVPLSHRNSLTIASSHYTLSYFVNQNKNRLEFNFSIPKYLYGNNVMQFINLHDQSSYYTYSELKLFFYKFLRDNFLEQPLHEDVQIARIDLCYNQIFNSKEDALFYLDKQKNLLAKYARTSRNRYRTYDTSLMYVTDRYSFKIYHKGEEFKKHDHMEIINAGNPLKYDLEKMQQTADCMLRYEMTFRNTMIGYLAKQNFYSSKKAENFSQYREHIVAKFLRRTVAGFSDWEFKGNRKKAFRSYMGRVWNFTLLSPFDTTRLTDLLLETNAITFDKDVFNMLFVAFWDNVKKYQLEASVSYATILDKIKQYNETNEQLNKMRGTRKKGLNINRIIVPAMLSQFINLEELRTKGIMKKSTFYELKTDLKKVGIDVHSIGQMRVNPKLDYSDYKIFLKDIIHTYNMV